MFRFIGRRLVLLAGARWRWVSRAVMLAGFLRWVRAKGTGRATVVVPRGSTLTVSLEQDRV